MSLHDTAINLLLRALLATCLGMRMENKHPLSLRRTVLPISAESSVEACLAGPVGAAEPNLHDFCDDENQYTFG
jgi:hypothetical protein